MSIALYVVSCVSISHEESYDYYYGPRQREGSPSSKGREGRKRRIAPPPPPGFEDEPPSPPPSKKRIAPPPPTDFSSEGDSGGVSKHTAANITPDFLPQETLRDLKCLKISELLLRMRQMEHRPYQRVMGRGEGEGRGRRKGKERRRGNVKSGGDWRRNLQRESRSLSC